MHLFFLCSTLQSSKAHLQKSRFQHKLFMIIFCSRNLERLCLQNIVGFILNLPSSIGWRMLTIPIKRRHWIAVRAIDRTYYNLDSKLKYPEEIGEAAALKYVFEKAKAISEVKCRKTSTVRLVSVKSRSAVGFV